MNTTEDTVIIGGGMIGRIVQRYAQDALILDWNRKPLRPLPPPQLGANYLWEPVADIVCERFPVYTTINGEPATLASIHAYKERVGKVHEMDTRLDVVMRQFQTDSWGYAFTEFPEPTRIMYEAHVQTIDVKRRIITLRGGVRITYHRLVSTIPLPALIKMSDTLIEGYGHMGFPSTPIYVHVDDYMALPSPRFCVDYQTTGACYRVVTHLNGETHVEYQHPVADVPTKKLVPGRIYDVHGTESLLNVLEESFDIYCFGRYARWDSDELTHISDLRIKQWAKFEGITQ